MYTVAYTLTLRDQRNYVSTKPDRQVWHFAMAPPFHEDHLLGARISPPGLPASSSHNHQPTAILHPTPMKQRQVWGRPMDGTESAPSVSAPSAGTSMQPLQPWWQTSTPSALARNPCFSKMPSTPRWLCRWLPRWMPCWLRRLAPHQLVAVWIQHDQPPVPLPHAAAPIQLLPTVEHQANGAGEQAAASVANTNPTRVQPLLFHDLFNSHSPPHTHFVS